MKSSFKLIYLLDYKRLEDMDGQSEILAKKAAIAQLRGDTEVAADLAKRFITLTARDER